VLEEMRLAALVLALAFACGSARAQRSDAPAADPPADPPSASQPNGLHGRLLVEDMGLFSQGDSIDAAAGVKDRNNMLANLRLTWEPTFGAWSAQAHYVVSAEYGPDVALARAQQDLLPIPPSTWANLTWTIVNQGQTVATQGLDRLNVAYSTPEWVIRVGRQALTWGSGLVFRPMDLFDPFSPAATDTEYKPGTDMLYVQRLFSDGSDLQFIVAPRPEVKGGPATVDASSTALHYHTTLFGHATTFLFAHDHGDWVVGAGVNGSLHGATWNIELVPTFLAHGGARFSAIANVSDATTLFGKNATVFGEYFHNGFGVASGPYNLADLPPDLLERLERGQLFNTRQDYLAGGMTLEVTPLLNLSPTLIVGLNDGSLLTLVQATYSLADNLTLVGGFEAPIGPAHTEFGGLPLTATSSLMVAPPAQIYIQLRSYF
jgi:hypothetical protein